MYCSGLVRGWWWLWTCCPGLGNARMADLRRLCRDQAIGPDQLWGWPIERLGQALAWPAHCLRDVARTGSSTGLLRSLTCLLVPFCRVILIGLVAWMICTHPLPGSTSKGIDRCSGTSMSARPSRWWARVPPRTIVLPWLKNWAVVWLRRVGPSLVVLRKELMLQPIAAVWPETVHPSRC